MSDKTKADLVKALRDHVADETSDDYPLLADWYLVAAAVGADPWTTNYVHVCSDAAPHTLMGLVRVAQRRLDQDHDWPASDDDED